MTPIQPEETAVKDNHLTIPQQSYLKSMWLFLKEIFKEWFSK